MANPGVNPELAQAGAGLAEAGRLEAYLTPTPVTADARWLRRLPPAVQHQLRRRELPAPLRSLDTRPVATLNEVLFKLSDHRQFVPARIQADLLEWRNRVFDREVARALPRYDAGLLGLATTSVASFRVQVSRGRPSVLNYPIAHHSVAERILAEEARRSPSWASTLQWHAPSQRRRWILDQEIALADLVLVQSQFQWQTFVDAGIDESKLALVPLGVDVAHFAPDASSRPPSHPFTIGFVGQLTQRKGLGQVVEAFRRLDRPDVRLLLAGSEVGDAGRLAQGPNVEWVGHVPRGRLPELYRSLDVMVLPSFVEGFCLTPVEAMACGVPVIVSDRVYVAERIQAGVQGWVVDPGDADSLLEILRMAVDHRERLPAMGAAARAVALGLTWTDYRRRLVSTLAKRVS